MAFPEKVKASDPGGLDAGKLRLARLTKAHDLLALADLYQTIRKDSSGLAEKDLKAWNDSVGEAYDSELRYQLGHMVTLIKAGMWESKDCRALHEQLAIADPKYASFTDKDFLNLLEEEDSPEDLDLPDGYASDDSDDDEPPRVVVKPKVDPSQAKGKAELRRMRKQAAKKHHKNLKKLRDEAPAQSPKSSKSGPAPSTWRTYGGLEPDPNAIIQFVIQNRLNIGKQRDELEKERAQHGRILERYKTKTSPKAQQKAKDATAKLGELTAQVNELEAQMQRVNAAIRHSPAEWTSKVENDFSAAKRAFADPDPKKQKDGLRAIATKFCIAQYRGITYNNLIFNAEQRRLSRNRKEVGEPVFSMSVLEAAGVRPDDYFEGRATEDDKGRLLEQAQKLKAVLLGKRKPQDVVVNGYTYQCYADAIQDIYTNAYDYFHSTISSYLKHQAVWKDKGDKVDVGFVPIPPMDFSGYDKKKETYEQFVKRKSEEYMRRCEALEAEVRKKELISRYGGIPVSDWALFDGLLNGKNPFVSTGDSPRHALKYAYGMKYYQGHYHEQLKACWSPEGKALHPYSGKVFVMLSSLDEYLDDAPNHVPSMNQQGRIVVGDMIADERETCFPAYIPGERVILEHVCKFPSFHRPWSPLYLRKYGLDKETYDEFAAAIKGQEVQSEGTYRNLESWLVNFHEARLIDLVRRYALKKGMLLVYRDSSGALARELTSTKVHKGTRFLDPMGKKQVLTLDRRSTLRVEGATQDDRRVAKDKGKSSASASPKARPTFLQRVTTRGYTIHGVPGDGNCFFHALLAAGKAAGLEAFDAYHDHVALRQNLVVEYRNHADVCRYQAVDEAYITEMLRPAAYAGQVSRWGSDAEIILFCRAYGVRVTVLSPRFPNDRADFDPQGAPLATLYLVNSYGNHWEWADPPPG